MWLKNTIRYFSTEPNYFKIMTTCFSKANFIEWVKIKSGLKTKWELIWEKIIIAQLAHYIEYREDGQGPNTNKRVQMHLSKRKLFA